MKPFRSIGLALAGMLGACLAVVACLPMSLVRSVAYVCKDMACGVQKLKRELVLHFNSPALAMTGTGCGLTPESNGFRQSSAYGTASGPHDERPDV